MHSNRCHVCWANIWTKLHVQATSKSNSGHSNLFFIFRWLFLGGSLGQFANEKRRKTASYSFLQFESTNVAVVGYTSKLTYCEGHIKAYNYYRLCCEDRLTTVRGEPQSRWLEPRCRQSVKWKQEAQLFTFLLIIIFSSFLCHIQAAN